MVTGSLTEAKKIIGRVEKHHTIVGVVAKKKIITGIIGVHGTPYGGDYVVTPTDDTQVLSTSGLRMNSDVIINPIPSNWGLITWDGHKITVS